ncbi:16S rRNA (cytosine(967)-C(5))-methyltransferase, partial [Pseudomonas aeruginosa]
MCIIDTKQAWPDQLDADCGPNNAHPPMTMRVKRGPGERDCYLAQLAQAGIKSPASDITPDRKHLAGPR